jgi:hypothetical protein
MNFRISVSSSTKYLEFQLELKEQLCYIHGQIIKSLLSCRPMPSYLSCFNFNKGDIFTPRLEALAKHFDWYLMCWKTTGEMKAIRITKFQIDSLKFGPCHSVAARLCCWLLWGWLFQMALTVGFSKHGVLGLWSWCVNEVYGSFVSSCLVVFMQSSPLLWFKYK